MSKITLITGGARSGKSSYAENLLDGNDGVLYIATAIRTDQEMEARIEHHIKSRNPKWETSEGYQDLGEVLRETDKSFILLDCVTNMISNLIFASDQDLDKASQLTLDELYHTVFNEFQELVEAARSSNKTLILVSNEVGMGLISEYKLGRVFVDFAGWINQWLAKEADEVTFMVSGLPLYLKQDPIKQDHTEQDSLRQEQVNSEATKKDSMNQEISKQDSMDQESMKQESMQQESTQQESMKHEPIQRVSMKEASMKQESMNQEQLQEEPVKQKSLKQNPSEDV